jgi:hypothetical protein
MYARVTRFTGGSAEQIAKTVSEVDATEGPPPGVNSKSLKVLVDEAQGTVIFVGFFETEEDLKAADSALREFDPPGGVPGTRASVDLCEVKVEKETS